ncbi:MAG: class I SAM-dependent methyltransferase, partial [Myxococcota bacterium]
ALGRVLDLACGSGRNALPLARDGSRVIGLDRSRERLGALAETARAERLPLLAVCADLEAGGALPLATASAGAVLVFRYLHRPLGPELERVLRPGGLLVYETFTIHHREVAEHPRNPAFLLEPGELPALFPGLEVLRYEEAQVRAPTPRAVARLVARKPA